MASLNVEQYRKTVIEWDCYGDAKNFDDDLDPKDVVGQRLYDNQVSPDTFKTDPKLLANARYHVQYPPSFEASSEQETKRTEKSKLVIDLSRANLSLQGLFITLDSIFAIAPAGYKVDGQELLEDKAKQNQIAEAIVSFLSDVHRALPSFDALKGLPEKFAAAHTDGGFNPIEPKGVEKMQENLFSSLETLLEIVEKLVKCLSPETLAEMRIVPSLGD